MNIKYNEAMKANSTNQSTTNRYPVIGKPHCRVVQTNFKQVKSISVKYFDLTM